MLLHWKQQQQQCRLPMTAEQRGEGSKASPRQTFAERQMPPRTADSGRPDSETSDGTRDRQSHSLGRARSEQECDGAHGRWGRTAMWLRFGEICA